jgi:hypothetical protein
MILPNPARHQSRAVAIGHLRARQPQLDGDPTTRGDCRLGRGLRLKLVLILRSHEVEVVENEDLVRQAQLLLGSPRRLVVCFDEDRH